MLTTTNRSLTSIFAKLSQACAAVCIMALPTMANAQSDQVTFHKDIEPILQRSCQNCHRAGGVGAYVAGVLTTRWLHFAGIDRIQDWAAR